MNLIRQIRAMRAIVARNREAERRALARLADARASAA